MYLYVGILFMVLSVRILKIRDNPTMWALGMFKIVSVDFIFNLLRRNSKDGGWQIGFLIYFSKRILIKTCCVYSILTYIAIKATLVCVM